MSVSTKIVDGSICESAVTRIDGAGAILEFHGIVRPEENGEPIAGLRYAAYEPMASQMLDALARSALAQFGLKAIHLLHSIGDVPAGKASLYIAIESVHRREGLEAMTWLIDELKRDVPIWKTPYCATRKSIAK